jgi:predicted N-acyltransferase
MLTYKILDSVNQIDRAEWNLIFGDIPEGYGFFKTIEESNLEGFSFSYVLICEGKDILLIASLFSADFNLDIAAKGTVQKLILCIRKFLPRFLIVKTLFCGSPFGENGILGIKKDAQDKEALICALTKIMKIICKEKNIPLVMFKDFLKESVSILEPLQTQGFFMVEGFPAVVTELPFHSLDDYFKSLSHNTRKDLRRKIKKAQSAKAIEVKVINNAEDEIFEIYRLYLNTYNAAGVRFEKLTPEFFINIGRNMSTQTKFFLYYFGDKLAAFNLCFVNKDTLIDKFIGFDYNIAYKYNLYFFSWCYNIEWCLKNSMHYYQVGQTDYHPKIRLGGRLVPLYAYLKHGNPVLNLILKLLAKVLKPANFDETINV